MCSTGVFFGEELARYSFGKSHPWNYDRIYHFQSKIQSEHLDIDCRLKVEEPCLTDEETILMFHNKDYVELVKNFSRSGSGVLDMGDTPAFKGMFEASCFVIGSTLKALDIVATKKGGIEHAFNPIGGLHHARRDSAGGFCVFNDIGIAALVARKKYGLHRILYVDIDAHHGDGVYYEFQDDPLFFIADIHEDGNFLYPGTGSELETGIDQAEGTKLNIPLKPRSSDTDFIAAFHKIEEFIDNVAKFDLIIFQSGADCLADDPLAHLNYTSNAHRYSANVLHRISHEYCNGRIIALGGGGYNNINLSVAWVEVIKSFIKNPKFI